MTEPPKPKPKPCEHENLERMPDPGIDMRRVRCVDCGESYLLLLHRKGAGLS